MDTAQSGRLLLELPSRGSRDMGSGERGMGSGEGLSCLKEGESQRARLPVLRLSLSGVGRGGNRGCRKEEEKRRE